MIILTLISELAQGLGDDQVSSRRDLRITQHNEVKTEQEQDSARHQRILEWISPLDYPAQQRKIIKRKHEGTLQWFIEAPEMTRWLSEANGALFCPGIPGAGKTTAAATVIDHLSKSVQNDSCGLAYIYGNYEALYDQSAYSMLAAILKQLVQGRISLIEHIERLHEHHVKQKTRLSLNELFATLNAVIADYSTVYLVIDALDECNYHDRTNALAKLRELRLEHDVRVMITSRSTLEFSNTFKKALKLEVRARDEDVRRYLADQIDRMHRYSEHDPMLQRLVENRIAEVTDGMYAFVRA